MVLKVLGALGAQADSGTAPSIVLVAAAACYRQWQLTEASSIAADSLIIASMSAPGSNLTPWGSTDQRRGQDFRTLEDADKTALASTEDRESGERGKKDRTGETSTRSEQSRESRETKSRAEGREKAKESVREPRLFLNLGSRVTEADLQHLVSPFGQVSLREE